MLPSLSQSHDRASGRTGAAVRAEGFHHAGAGCDGGTGAGRPSAARAWASASFIFTSWTKTPGSSAWCPPRRLLTTPLDGKIVGHHDPQRRGHSRHRHGDGHLRMFRHPSDRKLHAGRSWAHDARGHQVRHPWHAARRQTPSLHERVTPDRVTINEPIEAGLRRRLRLGRHEGRAVLPWRHHRVQKYDVTITEDVPRDECEPERVIDVYEDPFRFRLTSLLPGKSDEAGYIDFPAPLPYHQWFWVVQGAAQVLIQGAASAIPLSTSYGPAGNIPPVGAADSSLHRGSRYRQGAL